MLVYLATHRGRSGVTKESPLAAALNFFGALPSEYVCTIYEFELAESGVAEQPTRHWDVTRFSLYQFHM